MYFKLTSFGMCRRLSFWLSILDFSARCFFFFFCFCSSCIIITNAKIFICKPINAFDIICIIICLEIAKIKCTLIFVIKKSSNSHRQKKIECSKSAYGFTFLSFSLSHHASYCRGDLASLFVFVYVIVLTCWWTI